MPEIISDQTLSPIVGAAFWIFLAVVVVAGIWYAHARDRAIQETIRLAIDKSVQLDAELVDKLISGKSGKAEDYYIGGIITLAVGLGLPILGYFIGRIAPLAVFPIVGSGILVLFISLALLACGKLVSRRETARREGSHQA